MSPKRRLTFISMAAAMGCVAALVLAEVVIRLFVPDGYWRLRMAQDVWALDPRLGWRNAPLRDERFRLDGTLLHWRTDEHGVQPPVGIADAPEILLMGDSTVVARSVPESERLAAQLQLALADKGVQMRVRCAGVEGYSTDQSMLLLRELLPVYHPRLVVHMTCANDFHANASNTAYGFPKPRCLLQTDGTLNVIAPDLSQAPQLASTDWHDPRQVIQRIALYRLLQPMFLRLRSSSDTTLRNVAATDDMFGNETVVAQADWSLYAALIREMKRDCESQHATLLLTQHPSLGEVNASDAQAFVFEKRLREVATDTGVAFAPVLPTFRSHRTEGPFHQLPRDPHCNARGYQLTAKALAKSIIQLDLK